MSKKNKKLKLAVYGCSFASINYGPEHLLEYAWPNLLKQDYIVDVYSAPGSSLFYSYKKFLETYINYDVIVFSQTTYGRWFLPIEINGEEIHISHLQALNQIKKYIKEENVEIDHRTKKKLEALESYFIHLEEISTSYLIDTALINHVKSLRKDAIVIPIHFWQSTQNKFQGQFAPADRRLLKRDTWQFDELNLVNHFPIEYQEEFYKIIKESIEKQSFNHLTLDINIPLNSFDYYYVKL